MRPALFIAFGLGLLLACAFVFFFVYGRSSAQTGDASPDYEISDEEMEQILADAENLQRRIEDAIPNHAAGVTAGSALSWRELDRRPVSNDRMQWFIWAHVGNFDTDPDQEILHTSAANDDYVIDADGNRLKLDYPLFTAGPVAGSGPGSYEVWDFDGDRIDDLLDYNFERLHAGPDAPNRDQLKDHIVAYNLQGRLLGKIGGVPMGPYIARGDLDGDGAVDLFMDEEGDYGPNPDQGTRGFTTGGKIILEAGNGWTMTTCTGDIDGDGRDEVIGTPGPEHGLMAIGVGQDEVPIPALNELLSGFTYSVDDCFDLDGDGTDECLNYHGHVLNLVTGEQLQLEQPPGYAEFIAASSGTKHYQGVSFAGQRCLAAMVGDDIVLPESVVVWDSRGRVVYAENFGELLSDFHVLHANGQDHLVVLTRSRLLIAP